MCSPQAPSRGQTGHAPTLPLTPGNLSQRAAPRGGVPPCRPFLHGARASFWIFFFQPSRPHLGRRGPQAHGPFRTGCRRIRDKKRKSPERFFPNPFPIRMGAQGCPPYDGREDVPPFSPVRKEYSPSSFIYRRAGNPLSPRSMVSFPLRAGEKKTAARQTLAGGGFSGSVLISHTITPGAGRWHNHVCRGPQP